MATATAHDHLHESAGADAVAAAIAALRAQGERVTKPRAAILTTLAENTRHLTADEVVELVAASDIHRATVYRTLDLLVETGVVLRRHSPGGAAQHHLAALSHGHEHLHGHCRSCGAVVSLPVDALDAAAEGMREATGFVLQPVASTLSGLCAECSGAGRTTT